MWYINAIIKKVTTLYKPHADQSFELPLFNSEVEIFSKSLTLLFHHMENIYINKEEIGSIIEQEEKVPVADRVNRRYKTIELISSGITQIKDALRHYRLPEVVIENVPLLPVAVIYLALDQYYRRLALINVAHSSLFEPDEHLRVIFICLMTALKHECDSDDLFLKHFEYALDPTQPFDKKKMAQLEISHLKLLGFKLEISIENIIELFSSLDANDKRLFYSDLAHCEEMYAEKLLQLLTPPRITTTNKENMGENAKQPRKYLTLAGRSKTLPTLFYHPKAQPICRASLTQSDSSNLVISPS